MEQSSRKLSYNLSIYLDLLRLLAALTVFATHSRNFLFPSLSGDIFDYGREAVAIFFVLSGFVICFVISEKEKDWRSYLVARLARIYPVAIATILVTVVADGIGHHLNPSHYALLNDHFHFYRPVEISSVLKYLTFTNQIWFSHTIVGTDEPYWSLGFEVWYYVLFGILVFARNFRVVVITMVAVACGPKILMYFPLWLIGVFAYKAVIRKSAMSQALAGFLFAFSIVALITTIQHLGARATDMYHEYDGGWKELTNFAYFTIIGSTIFFNIVAFDALTRDRQVWSPQVARAIRWMAGASFTLYLVHQPLEVFISAFFNETPTLFQATIGVFITLSLVLLLAGLLERRKKIFAKVFRKAIDGLSSNMVSHSQRLGN